MAGFPTADRALASVAALALFALNDARMFQTLPREPTAGHVHAVTLQILGKAEPVYLSTFDMAVRWGFIGLTVGLCLFALAETFQRTPQKTK